MIVPNFWAEAVLKTRERNRHVTVRKFGWSDVGPAEAQAMAESRARDALARIARGEHLSRRDRKTPYNPGEGVPIREEVVRRSGESVITRNVYGALCLNTPNVLFADLDFRFRPAKTYLFCVVLAGVASVVVAWREFGKPGTAVVVGLLGLVAGFVVAAMAVRLGVRLRGGAERIVRRRVERFLASRPNWRVRLYRTPAGVRILALHAAFDPRSDEVGECFAALDVDPVYARLCGNQNCFRARVSPKPWRIGVPSPRKSAFGRWPVAPERRIERSEWISRYEAAALGFSACRFLEELGSGTVHPSARTVQVLHDNLCEALDERPIA